MKVKIVLFILLSLTLGFSGSFELEADKTVDIRSKFWGKGFYQHGKKVKTLSLFTRLDAYQSSKDPAAKAKAYYFPAWISSGAGVLLMVVPLGKLATGDDFPTGMFLGGAGFLALGGGLFKVSNIYLNKAVGNYNREVKVGPSAALEMQLKINPNPRHFGVLAQLNF